MIKFNKEFLTGLTVGFGAGIAVGAFSGNEKMSLQKISKNIVRLSVLTVETVREAIARAKENLEDLTAEVKSEMRAEPEAPAQAYQQPRVRRSNKAYTRRSE